ncbi:hypothetical protein BKA64DRAFT_388235 [Cadophora sp. MPI-SDFR-AT-0126]|nr:hypothetical protein BKA64DRAFT_388235 [Leotiomycetes sp. MPI-SDFR-AT-0126]
MEGLGAAASVIAVASLTLQLVESVRQLREFWQSVTEAPESVGEIARELQVLSTILAQIANTTLPERPNENMKLALETCASQIEPLLSMTRQLIDHFRSNSTTKRKWAAIKSVFKAEKINQIRNAIERTKSTLLLAYQQHLVMMIAAGFREQQMWRDTMTHLVPGNCIQRNVVGVVESDISLSPIRGRLEEVDKQKIHGIEYCCRGKKADIMSTSKSKIRRPGTQIGASYTDISSIFGKFSLLSKRFSAQRTVSSDEEEDRHQSEESYLTIRPALWLARFGLKYGIRVNFFQSPGSWKHTLNTFRPVPDDSLIFEFCRLGNIEGVQLLLERGQASTWDTNSEDETPLHLAVGYGHFQLCKVLLEIGADAEVRNGRARSCFNIACSQRGTFTSASLINILRLFIHQADLSELGNYDWWGIDNLANGQARESSQDCRYTPRLSSLTWVVETLKESITENIDAVAMASILAQVGEHWTRNDMKVLLAEFGGLGTNTNWNGYTPLHYCVWFQDYITARSLVQQGAQIHSIASNIFWNPVGESPTSIALYSSTAFSAWRQLLEDEQLLCEEFISRELQQWPLRSQHWDKDSLMQVFASNLSLAPAAYPNEYCRRCSPSYIAPRTCSPLMVEIAWQDVLQQFNPRQEIMDLLDDLRLIDDPRSLGSLEKDETCECQGSNDSIAVDSSNNSTSDLPGMTNTLSETFCDKAPGNRSFEYEWLCIYCWHYKIGTPGAFERLVGQSDTGTGISDESDSDSEDIHSCCDDNDDRDYDSSSEDSPFLLSI